MRLLNKTSLILLFLASAALAACTNVGPTDDPIRRHFTWERYVGGQDLAQACMRGQPERFRLVYNAIYDEQRRSYDLTGMEDGGAMLEARAIGPGNLVTMPLSDPLQPWRGETSLFRLTAADFAGLKAVLEQAGFRRPAPEGLFLRGDDFYWAASSCEGGEFHFYAWSNEQPGFSDLPLLAALGRFDRTGVEPNPPRQVPLAPYSLLFNTTQPHGRPIPHRLRVGKNGLDD